MNEPLLDPAAAAAAGAAHCQLASGLAGGGLALSCHKLVGDGARALVLLAPGLFRLDVRAVADTLQVSTRTLHAAPARWSAERAAAGEFGHKEEDTPEPYRVEFRFRLDDGPRPVLARLMLASTTDRAALRTHFVAQAIVRRAS